VSGELKCPHCGGEYQDYLTDVGICCFSCVTEPYDEQSRLCQEIVARRKAEDELASRDQLIRTQNLIAKEDAKILQLWKRRAEDFEEVARITVEYIEDHERRVFYRKQIEVAGTDDFQEGGAR
jgi:long-subunit acyl-CoA synthetase (AMP-forming)